MKKIHFIDLRILEGNGLLTGLSTNRNALQTMRSLSLLKLLIGIGQWLHLQTSR